MTETIPSDSVGKVLLPVLLHEVNNTTQLLVGLRALLDIPGGEELFARRNGDLAHASEKMHDLGFAMAVVATAGGANMLLARRHARAVGILWGLTTRALERADGVRIDWSGEPPETAPNALDGWQAPWSVSALLIEVSRATGLDEWRWEWTPEGALVGHSHKAKELTGEVGDGMTGDALLAIEERVPGLTIRATETALEWLVPSDWIRA